MSLDNGSAKRIYMLSALRKIKEGVDKDFFEGGEGSNPY